MEFVGCLSVFSIYSYLPAAPFVLFPPLIGYSVLLIAELPAAASEQARPTRVKRAQKRRSHEKVLDWHTYSCSLMFSAATAAATAYFFGSEDENRRREEEERDAALARSLQEVENERASETRGADRSTRSGRKPSRKRALAGDAALARQLQEQEDGDDDSEVVVLDAKVARNSAAAEREAVVPFARHIDRTRPQLELRMPTDTLLVNAATYRILKWGLNGHRDALRSYAPSLHELAACARGEGRDSVALTPQQLAAHRGEWEQLPVCVPQIPPRDGFVYVTHEANDRINVGSELYHRIFVEEGALPKQMEYTAYEQQMERSKEFERANRADRKRFGGTAALGVKLHTIKTARNGDCFFDALCKAYALGDERPHRDHAMWQAAAPLLDHGSAVPGTGGTGGASTSSDHGDNGGWSGRSSSSLRARGEGGGSSDGKASATARGPEPTVPLTVKELRGVVAAHFPEEAWLIGQSIGGESFAFIVDDSLDLTKANVAAPADDAADRAYWADESAIAVLQRYLSVRLLIFNPNAAEGNRCQCLGEVPCPPGYPRTYILLCHTHRSSKMQHYELYAKPAAVGGRPTAIFDDATLPAGVKRAFASACPDASPAWRTATDPDDANGAGSSHGGNADVGAVDEDEDEDDEEEAIVVLEAIDVLATT